jgi:hypothetical protein
MSLMLKIVAAWFVLSVLLGLLLGRLMRLNHRRPEPLERTEDAADGADRPGVPRAS